MEQGQNYQENEFKKEPTIEGSNETMELSGVEQKNDEVKYTGTSKKATISLVLGIMSMLLAWILPAILVVAISIVGLWFGFKGMKSSKRKKAIIGIILCILGIVFTIISMTILFTKYKSKMPPSPNEYEASKWTSCDSTIQIENNEKCYQIIDEKIKFNIPKEWDARMSNSSDLNTAPALILYSKNNDQSFEIYLTYYGPFSRANKEVKPKTEQALERRLKGGLKTKDGTIIMEDVLT